MSLVRSLSKVPRMYIGNFQKRFLFSYKRLGVKHYMETKDKIESPAEKTEHLTHRLRALLEQENTPIPSELLYYYLHLADDSPHAIQLLKDSVIRYSERDEYLRFGSPPIGPCLMRYCYQYRLNDLALEFYLNDKLSDFLYSTINAVILMSSLYNVDRFHETLQVFELFAARKSQPNNHFLLMNNAEPIETSPNAMLIYMTACYKINTDEAADKAEAMHRHLCQMGCDIPYRRTLSVYLALLINCGRLKRALEIVSARSDPLIGVYRDIKILLHARLGLVAEAIDILRSSFNESLQPNSVNFVFRYPPDMLEELHEAVQRKMDVKLTRDYEEVVKALKAFNRIGNARMDDIFTAPLYNRRESSLAPLGDDDDTANDNEESHHTHSARDLPPPRSNNQRRFPGLAELQD